MVLEPHRPPIPRAPRRPRPARVTACLALPAPVPRDPPRPRTARAAAYFALLALLLPAAARAESAALLAPGGEARMSTADKQRALAALTAALEAEEVRVMARAEADRRLGRRSPLRDCGRVDCGIELRRALAVDLVAGVALWPDAGGDRPTSAVVTLLDATGAPFDATAPVTNDDLPAAVAAAYTRARERQRRGPGPWLHIEGGPAGAVVTIDGTDEGVLPFHGRVTAGEHTLRVHLTGHRAHEQPLQVAPGAATEVRLLVTLAPEPAAARVTPPRRTGPTGPTPPGGGHERPRGRAVLGPLVVGVVGLAGIAVGAYGLLTPDDCERRGPSGTCLRIDEANVPVSLAYAGAGLAAVVAAVVWFAMSGGGQGDGEAEGDTSDDGPTLEATGSGLDLRMTF